MRIPCGTRLESWLCVMMLACLMTGCPDTSASSDAAGDSITDGDAANDLGDVGHDAMPDGPAPMDALDDLGDASDAADTMDATEVSPPGCVPGMSIACACIDGRMGAQVCLADHTYGPCQCAMADGGMPSDVVLPPLGARLIAPQSVSRVTSRRPTMRWVLPDGVMRARVEVCADRPCARVLMQQEVTGTSWRPTAMLAPGVTWWRVRGLDGDGGVAWSSATWEFVVGQRDAPVDTSFGTIKDFNGDGYDDVAVAQVGFPAQINIYNGRSAMGTALPMRQLASEPETYEYVAGDFNGDGLSDIAATLYDRGVVQIRYGAIGGISQEPTLFLSQPGNEGFGRNLASGDVDGDGFSDLILFSVRPPDVAPVSFQWQIFRGGVTGLSSTVSTTISPPDDYVWSVGNGEFLFSAGDFNGDGYADVLTANPLRRGTGIYDHGRAWIVAGSSTMPLQTWVRLEPPTPALGFGQMMSSVGDLDGNGVADFAVASNDEVSVYLGTARGFVTTPARTISNPESPCDLPSFGNTIGSAGDYNGDGRADLAIGAPCQPYPGPLGPGRGGVGSVFLYQGRVGGVSDAPVVFRGLYPEGGFGGGIGGLGDFNGDGYGDLVVLQVGIALDGRMSANPRVNVLLGSPSGPSFEGRWIFVGTSEGFSSRYAWIQAATHQGRA